MAQWIGGECDTYTVGQIGFLVEVDHTLSCGPSDYQLRERPAHTNRSHEPRLHGWCGTTDDIAIHARGIARVTRIARNGRALVVALTGADRAAALEELGYPELDPTAANARGEER